MKEKKIVLLGLLDVIEALEPSREEITAMVREMATKFVLVPSECFPPEKLDNLLLRQKIPPFRNLKLQQILSRRSLERATAKMENVSGVLRVRIRLPQRRPVPIRISMTPFPLRLNIR